MAATTTMARIPLGAAFALCDNENGDLPLYLPNQSGAGQVLYRQAGVGIALPDVERLREAGLSHLAVDSQHLAQCEIALEENLGKLLHDERLDPQQRAICVQAVGTRVVHDLMSSNEPSAHVKRASVLVDAVVESIMSDPQVAANLLRVSAHHKNTASHMFSVSLFGVLLGYAVYGPEEKILQEIGLAGMLHDLGKTSIPAEILNKTSPLTADEMRVIQHHPIETVRLLGDDPAVNLRVRQMILQHHERVDGLGYPLGLSESELLTGSKILSIVDSFHALIGRRAYQASKGPAEAMRLMRYHLNAQFDEKIFNTWTRLLSRYWNSAPEVFEQEANDEVAPAFHHDHKRIKDEKRERMSARMACRGRIKVKCIYAGRLDRASEAADHHELAVHDLSRTGMCMYSDHPMYRGEMVNMQVSSQDRMVWVRAIVRWCRRDKQVGRFQVGVQFLHRLSESQSQDKTLVACMEDQRLFPELIGGIGN